MFRQWCAMVTMAALLARGPDCLAQTDDVTAAQQAAQAAQAAVSEASARQVIPFYSLTSPETAYAGTDLGAAARQRIASCSMTPTDPVCQGNIAALSAAGSPRGPLGAAAQSLGAAAAIARSPSHQLGGLNNYYSGCTGSGACPANSFCFGERCFDTTYTSDTDFAQTMSYLEAAREAGVYLDPATLKVFSGDTNVCKSNALSNCCYADDAGKGMTNQSVFGTGTQLVYDVLMNSGNRDFVAQGLSALMTNASMSGTFTSYGVTVAVNGVALPAGSVTLFASESVVIAVDPWSLAIAIIIYVIMEVMSCKPGEAQLAMKEGAKLCVSIGRYCSTCIRVLGKCVSCIEHATAKCCFNSVLARLINEQGRRQLGMSWGTAEAPACDGFSIAQLQALDFSKIDLSEFYASIIPAGVDAEKAKADILSRVTSCYYGSGKCLK